MCMTKSSTKDWNDGHCEIKEAEDFLDNTENW